MRRPILIFLLWLPVLTAKSQLPATKPVRIADSLTAKELAARNPVLLRAELDSLVRLYAPPPVQVRVKEPIPVRNDRLLYIILAGIALLTALQGWLLYRSYTKKRVLEKGKNGRAGQAPATLEEKIGILNEEIRTLTKNNEGLSRVVKEYNGIQQEFDSLKAGIRSAYKVKHYPGYDPGSRDTLALQGVLDTEKAVADYAWEKFLKPILRLTDAHKNSPSRIPENDRLRLLDLLLSLSLLYIEYLYLRVSDLSVGGSIIGRMQQLAEGKNPDPSVLKKLDREYGNRALVIRMVLDKASLKNLSYPVFDETNLNPTTAEK